MKPKQNDPVCVDVFGDECLEQLHDEFLLNYMDESIKLDANIFSQTLDITEVLYVKLIIAVKI